MRQHHSVWIAASRSPALADPPRGRGREYVMSRPTLRDGAPEQPLGTGHGKQRADAHSPSRLTEDGDVAGIATEGGYLVKQAAVGVSLAEIEKTLGTVPIIDGHADDAVAGETTAVIPGRRTRSVILKHTARNPDHHREPSRILRQSTVKVLQGWTMHLNGLERTRESKSCAASSDIQVGNSACRRCFPAWGS